MGLVFVRDLTARGETRATPTCASTARSPAWRRSKRAERRGFIRSARAVDLFARLTGQGGHDRVGTYRLSGAASGIGNLRALERPVSQRLRLPSTNWAKRDASLLQRHEVCPADDYMAEVTHPEGRQVAFPLPSGTLEGYLYPDTYDLPPLLGAKAVVDRQLRAFDEKVWEPLGHPADLARILKVASLVELEAGRDDERPIIAGVIENRLRRGMRLQIDASLLYGMGKWRRLRFADYRRLRLPVQPLPARGDCRRPRSARPRSPRSARPSNRRARLPVLCGVAQRAQPVLGDLRGAQAEHRAAQAGVGEGMRDWRSGDFDRARLGGPVRSSRPPTRRRACPRSTCSGSTTAGKRLILLDVDNTLVQWKTEEFSPEVVAWVERAKAMGFGLCIISNTHRLDRLERLRTSLGVETVRGRFKPSRAMFRLALIKFGRRADEAVMVGDQMMTDVLGANRAGIDAIWVRKMEGKEFGGTRINRLIEAS